MKSFRFWTTCQWKPQEECNQQLNTFKHRLTGAEHQGRRRISLRNSRLVLNKILICSSPRELGDAPDTRVSPIVGEPSRCASSYLALSCCNEKCVFAWYRAGSHDRFSRLSECVCIVIFQWEIKTGVTQMERRQGRWKGFEGRRADSAAICSEGRWASGEERGQKKRASVRGKQQEFWKSDRFCTLEEADAFRAICVPRGKV